MNVQKTVQTIFNCTQLDESKSSAQIVDELFKELELKNLQNISTCLPTVTDLQPEKQSQIPNTNTNLTPTRLSIETSVTTDAKRDRGLSSIDGSNDTGSDVISIRGHHHSHRHHRHHKRRKSKRSDGGSRKRHKHKRKSRKHSNEDEIEWESDSGGRERESCRHTGTQTISTTVVETVSAVQEAITPVVQIENVAVNVVQSELSIEEPIVKATEFLVSSKEILNESNVVVEVKETTEQSVEMSCVSKEVVKETEKFELLPVVPFQDGTNSIITQADVNLQSETISNPIEDILKPEQIKAVEVTEAIQTGNEKMLKINDEDLGKEIKKGEGSSEDDSEGEIRSLKESEKTSMSPSKKSKSRRHSKKKHKRERERGKGSRERSVRKRAKSRSRSTDRYSKKSRRSRSSSRDRHRSRSSDKGWSRSSNNIDNNGNHTSDHRRRVNDSHYSNRRHRSRSPSKHRSSPGNDLKKRNLRRSRSPAQSPPNRHRTDVGDLCEKIDKAKLLEIARRNAMTMMSQGTIAGTRVDTAKQQQMVALKAGGKSVAELTNFCKQLAKKDGETSSSDEGCGRAGSDDETGPFIQHPFKLKETQPNIVMNIKNAVQMPVRTPAEKVAEAAKLRIQFPVSSGCQHRKKESEWVPVSPPKALMPPTTPSTSTIQLQKTKPATVCVTASIPVVSDEDKVFVEPVEQTAQQIDISNIITRRLRAVRKLQENPNDVEALSVIYHVQQQAQSWAESKQLPGLFTGVTTARLLTPVELAGPAHTQAWVKKDQFNRAPPVDGGMGMYLLRKMGWNPGEGLGKNKEGVTIPLMLDIKMDKKGLISSEEMPRKSASVPALKDLSGKHPVSALVELCSKRKWGPPDFILIHDSGPDHKKNFLFKVRINNVDYQPTVASTNKKTAKAQAAVVCLQALGLYPRDLNNPL